MELVCFGPPGSTPGDCDHPVTHFIYVGHGTDDTKPEGAGLACSCHSDLVEYGLLMALMVATSEIRSLMLEMVPEVQALEQGASLAQKDRMN